MPEQDVLFNPGSYQQDPEERDDSPSRRRVVQSGWSNILGRVVQSDRDVELQRQILAGEQRAADRETQLAPRVVDEYRGKLEEIRQVHGIARDNNQREADLAEARAIDDQRAAEREVERLRNLESSRAVLDSLRTAPSNPDEPSQPWLDENENAAHDIGRTFDNENPAN